MGSRSFPIYFGNNYYMGDAELRDRNTRTRPRDEIDAKKDTGDITTAPSAQCSDGDRVSDAATAAARCDGDRVSDAAHCGRAPAAAAVVPVTEGPAVGADQLVGPLNIMAAAIPIEPEWSTCSEWCTACKHEYCDDYCENSYYCHCSTNRGGGGGECVCASSFEIVFDESLYDDDDDGDSSGSDSDPDGSSSCSDPPVRPISSRPSVESLGGTKPRQKVNDNPGRRKRPFRNSEVPKNTEKTKRNKKRKSE